jgi:hypothetical protein
MRRFWAWISNSISNPENLPHYLTAIFTLALAIFAWYAWQESQRATSALQGQLLVLQTDDRPVLWVINTQGPIYRDETSQVVWGWQFANIGKSIAYNVLFNTYIKIGNENYQRGRNVGKNATELKQGDPIVVPPNFPQVQFGTVVSRSGINKDFFNDLLKQDFGVGILVEFEYTDASGQINYENAVCLERLSTGVAAKRAPDDCPKE